MSGRGLMEAENKNDIVKGFVYGTRDRASLHRRVAVSERQKGGGAFVVLCVGLKVG